MTDKTVNMYLENCIQEINDKKNIKTSEVIVITINLNTFEEKRIKKIDLLPTHITLYMCARDSTRESKAVGYARKSVWWMPWH